MQQGALNPRQQAAWQQWLNAHSEHQRAWDHMQRVNQRLRSIFMKTFSEHLVAVMSGVGIKRKKRKTRGTGQPNP